MQSAVVLAVQIPAVDDVDTFRCAIVTLTLLMTGRFGAQGYPILLENPIAPHQDQASLCLLDNNSIRVPLSSRAGKDGEKSDRCHRAAQHRHTFFPRCNLRHQVVPVDPSKTVSAAPILLRPPLNRQVVARARRAEDS